MSRVIALSSTRVGAYLAAAVISAGCGTPQATGVVPAAPLELKAPWMAKGLKQRELLYVSNANGTVSVYRYWQRTLVGVLTDFAKPRGMCTDRAGDVYITDYQRHKIYKYGHGGTKAIEVLSDPGYEPDACSVDPSTGNLAAMNFGPNYYNAGNVVIYLHASGQPLFYPGTSDDHFTSCVYNERGDLFIVSDSYYYYFSEDGSPVFYYLPKHETQMLAMDIPDPQSYSGWEAVQGLAWDGKYWLVESYDYLDRFTINIKAAYVGDTQISASYDYQGPIALYRPSLKAKATQVVADSDGFTGKSAVDFWAYPTGGDRTHTITEDLANASGVAISTGSP